MTVLIDDAFGRADESPLGSPYLAPTSGIPGTLRLVSNQVANTTAATDSWAYHNVTYPDDQWAEMTIAATGGIDFGPIVRETSTGSGYEVTPTGGGGQITIQKVVNGAFSLLTGVVAAYANGDVIYVEIKGNTLIVKQNGTTIITFTDSSSPLTGGKACLGGFDGTWRVNRFRAGDFLSANNALDESGYYPTEPQTNPLAVSVWS